MIRLLHRTWTEQAEKANRKLNSVETLAAAALSSWPLNPAVILLLAAVELIYFRGWLLVRRLLPHKFTGERLMAFSVGIALVWIAIESPLDAFSSLLLQAHMVQHLLLMMVAPALVLIGQPFLPLLRGLPRRFVKTVLGPFLTWPALRRLSAWLVRPQVAWLAFTISTVGWHIPALYELGLRSPGWHNLEHACFFWTGILFWWPVVQPWPSRPHSSRWIAIPYLLAADVVNTAISASLIFADKVVYPSYTLTQFAGISPREDQSIAGSIMWVPGSIIYLVPAVILAVRLISFSGSSLPAFQSGAEQRRRERVVSRSHAPFDLLRLPVFGSFARWKHSRRVAQALMLVAAIAIASDGLFGHQMAPMNSAGVLPWIHWRGFVILALLAAGNWFCFACPFMLPREVGKRLFNGSMRWPRKLRSKWLSAALLLLYFWAYEAFRLWNSPWLTAWIILSYFTAAFFIDGFFRGASFCKYVCPIGQFNFVSSLVSPFEVKVKREATCQSCRTYDCIRGNTKQRGCELLLFQPKKESSLDCTFCLDCVHACPHENVGILPVLPAATITKRGYRSSVGKLFGRVDLAVVSLVLVFAAFGNAAGMIAPVAQWQSVVSWPYPVSAAVFLGISVVLLPALLIRLCAATASQVTALPWKAMAVRFSFALVPIGVSMWAAHVFYHLATGAAAVVPLAQRTVAVLMPALNVVPNWTFAAQVPVPDWLRPLQVLLLDAGLLLSLYTTWRVAGGIPSRGSNRTLAIFAPWGILATVLYIYGAWIIFQPMQMRGMLMH